MKQVLALSFALFTCSPAFSQKGKPVVTDDVGSSYISLGYGTATPDYLFSRNRVDGVPGVAYFSYKYKFEPRTYLAFTLSGEQNHGDWIGRQTQSGYYGFLYENVKKGTFDRSCLTFAVDLSYDYIDKGIFRMYLVAGLGLTYKYEKDKYSTDYYNANVNNGNYSLGAMEQQKNSRHVNGNFAPLCFSVGRKLSCFMEFGFGYRGVVNTGLTYRVSNNKKVKMEKPSEEE